MEHLPFIILIALYAAIVGLIQKPFSIKLKQSTSLEEALHIRKAYKTSRIFSLIIFIILTFLAFLFEELYQDKSYVDLSVMMSTIMATFVGFVLTNGLYFTHKGFNPISFCTIKDFYNYKGNMSLFLRGFNIDNYKSKQDVSLFIGSQFSEFGLAKRLAKGSPLFAVGMTKELTAPVGAKRVYLSDASWKDDVLFMMNKATSIFIIVNSKESCVWEIEQSLNFLDKTCFIVDDAAQYEIVRDYFSDRFPFPNLLATEEPFPIAMRLFCDSRYKVINSDGDEDGVIAKIIPFPNSEDGYDMLIRELFGIKHKKGFLNRYVSN